MKTSVFYGYICPKCKSTIDIASIIGNNKIICSICNIEMIPNLEGKSVLANVRCPYCKSFYGLINSEKCPKCGTKFPNI